MCNVNIVHVQKREHNVVFLAVPTKGNPSYQYWRGRRFQFVLIWWILSSPKSWSLPRSTWDQALLSSQISLACWPYRRSKYKRVLQALARDLGRYPNCHIMYFCDWSRMFLVPASKTAFIKLVVDDRSGPKDGSKDMRPAANASLKTDSVNFNAGAIWATHLRGTSNWRGGSIKTK